MAKFTLCSLSFLWMASCLIAEELISDTIPSADQSCLPYKDECVTPCEEKKPACLKRTHHVFLEGKAAYFHPVNGKVRDIYASGIGLYGVELTFPTWRYIYGWVSGSYMSKVGHSIGEHSRTRVTLVPLGIGVKYVYTVKFVDVYAGAGVLATYFHTHDQSRFVISNTSKWAAGGIVKVGIFIRPVESFFIDLFWDYSIMKFDIHGGNKKVVRHDVNFSGWSLGGGIGWPF